MLCAVQKSGLTSDPSSPSIHHLSPCGFQSGPPVFDFPEDPTVPATSTSNTGSRQSSRHSSRRSSRHGESHRGSRSAEPSEVVISQDGICLFREDRFVEGELLGRGSFSLVHKAMDKVTGRQVALKTLLIADSTKVHQQRYTEALSNRVLHPNASQADSAAAAMAAAQANSSATSEHAAELIAEGVRPCSMQDALRELEIANVLRHVNIATIYGYFLLDKDVLVMVQELCVVGDIFTIMKPDGLSPTMSATLMPQALAGLAYMHSQQLVHMDMKPENMLICRNNVLKLCDFGSVAKAGVVLDFAIGTMQYVSPELVHACHSGTPLCASTSMDMFALGQIMFIVLTGRFMWECAAQSDPNYRNFVTGQHVKRRPWCLFPEALRMFLESLVQINQSARPTALQAKEWVDTYWLKGAQDYKAAMRNLTATKAASSSQSKFGTL